MSIDSKAKKRARTSPPTESNEEKKPSTQIKKEDEEGDEEDEEPVVKRSRRNGSTNSQSNNKKTTIHGSSKTDQSADKKAMPPPRKPVSNSMADSSDLDEPKSSAPIKHEPSETPDSASDAEQEDVDEESEEEKPEVAQKAREKVQSTLKSSGKDPYPDWKPGTPVPYAALCTTFSLIECTTKRLIITAHCALFFRQVLRLTPDDLLPTVLLSINKLAADYAGIELGIGESLIMKAIGEATGRSLAVIKQDQKEIGDLGLVAVKSRSKQPTMFKAKALTVRGMLKSLLEIAVVTGNGAQGRKVDGIKKLLSAADANSSGKIDITENKGGPSEAKYIVRFLEGKLRLGLAEKTVLVALAQAMVCHEVESKGGKVPSTEQLAKGEAIIKSVHRYVAFQVEY